MESSFIWPKVEAFSEDDKIGQSTENKTTSSLPLYRNSEQFDYYVDPPSRITSYVKAARIKTSQFKLQLQPFIDQVCDVYKTGKSHTQETLYHLQDEDNLLSRIGAMAMGGLMGLFAARRGRLLKKLSYTSIGIAGVGALCYPQEAKVLAREGVQSAKKSFVVGYHFVVGVRPKVENENGQAFDKIASTVSDVWQWGFRLINSQEKIEGQSIHEEDFKQEKKDIALVAEIDDEKYPDKEGSNSGDMNQQQNLMHTKEEIETGNETVLEGDLGQSYIEDKEMYTTRE